MFNNESGNIFANIISKDINVIEYVISGAKYRQQTNNSIVGSTIFFNITISNRIGTITKLSIFSGNRVVDSYDTNIELKSNDDMFIQIKYSINTGTSTLNFRNSLEVE